MGFLDRLFGTSPAAPRREPKTAPRNESDNRAIARYRYLLRTAPPEAIEQAHAEAFAQLTAEQRAVVLQQLRDELPESERGPVPAANDPQALARMATRAELRQPGSMERLFGPRSPGMGGMGMGGMFAGSLLSSIAGTFIGSAIAHQFLGGFGESQEAAMSDSSAEAEHATADADDEAQSSDDGNVDNGDYGDDDYGGGADFDV